MTKEFDNTNRGALFKNDDKDPNDDKDRDYSGTINVGGREYWLSGWRKKSKNGVPFLSLSVKAKNEMPVSRGGSIKRDLDDEIPF